MPKLERGFKSWCERVASAMRNELELRATDPLPARKLAQHLQVELITPHDVPGLSDEDLRQILVVDRESWSAASYSINGVTTVILNPTNSSARESTDIMHELSHLIRDHEPSQIILSATGEFAMSSFDPKQEDEANWLSGTLLLPRDALMQCRDAGKTSEQIAQQFGVSTALTNYRLRVTGIEQQFSRRKRFRPV